MTRSAHCGARSRIWPSTAPSSRRGSSRSATTGRRQTGNCTTRSPTSTWSMAALVPDPDIAFRIEEVRATLEPEENDQRLAAQDLMGSGAATA
jgi:hypothetical protein